MRIHLLALSLAALGVLADQSAADYAQDGNRLLAAGSYVEAARAYGSAIEIDPDSYVNYYKRATAYLSLGRHAAALDDFDAILRLNPGFSQAHLQKAKILAKEGEFEMARAELKAYGKGKAEEADQLAESMTAAIAAEKAATKAYASKAYPACVEHATRALEAGPNAVRLRELRIECATALGDADAVYGDLSRLSSLVPSRLSYALRAAHVAYFIHNSPAAATHLKQALHYDPDNAACKRAHRQLRALEKDTAKARNFVDGGGSASARQALKVFDGDDGLVARFEAALEAAREHVPAPFDARKRSASRLEIYALACKASVAAGDFGRKAARWCDEVLAMDDGNVDALVAKGERLMKDESWDEAVRVLERAFENGGRSSQDVANRLQKAQRLLKQSKAKDYYKVLGVPRDADDRTIKKAFRKAAKVNHPDVGGSEEKMAALNEAYEVLSDPELRQRYDNGDDPNDPGGGQRGNPFAHHGGMPFQFFQQGAGGGGQFFQQGGQRFQQGGAFGGQKMQFTWG
ncbi:Tetratricopeptide repeat and J domain-containing co-chaperone dnj1 [Cryptotrichosporon argae]